MHRVRAALLGVAAVAVVSSGAVCRATPRGAAVAVPQVAAVSPPTSLSAREVDPAQVSFVVGLHTLYAQELERREATADARASRSGTNLRSAPRSAAIATRPAGEVRQGAGACGGDLPPCWVLRKENRDADPTLWNGGCRYPAGYTGKPAGGKCRSTASGKWQITRGTWGSRLVDGVWRPGFGGYMNAADAPLDVQDAKARLLWAGGRGCAHWNACS